MSSAFCQFENTELYYPQNNLYIKNKVKTVKDSIFFEKPYIMTYDTLGRIISKYYEGDSTPTQFKYDRVGDTLFRFEYTVKDKVEDIYATELFLYNKLGNILNYQSIRKKHYYADQSDCRLHLFIYNEKGQLLFFHYYNNENYPRAYFPYLRIDVNQMQLFNSYAYSFDQKNKVFEKTQITGEQQWKKIDSLFYDLNNRLIKFKSFQQNGYLGELRGNNITISVEYNYEASKMVKKSFSTFTKGTSDIIFTGYLAINETIYLANGLEKIKYCGIEKNDKHLCSQFIYTYYE